MLTANNSSGNGVSSSVDPVAFSHYARFWMILPFYVPSLICSLFVLYHYITNRTLRQALHNHVIIILLSINLIVQLTGIPWNLSYYRLEYVSPQSQLFCIIWIVVDEGLHISITLFFAWATIERHILIFHDRLVSTKQKIFVYHYFPIILIFCYCICYIFIVIIFPPCENTFDYTAIVCGYPLCYYDNQFLTIWDVMVDHITPVIIIISCSIGLLLRIVYQKSQMRQRIRWKNYRKMTIQLLSISFLYLVLHTPHILMEFVYILGVSEDVGSAFMAYAEFFEYYSNIFLPFICAGSMPELKAKLKKTFPCCRRQRRIIQPETITLSHRPVIKIRR
ncbi:unnamed protein product [Adineta steineri]|uniref:G-protein coupled receptors family 1 profile domain-containing protein n=2 Tax=Adineta steineri TaxID=433720 RepID=A0A818V276_9BILA|nr:unnamed protein product [Adineta steineri]